VSSKETQMLLVYLLISSLTISCLQSGPRAMAAASNATEGSIRGTVYDSAHNLVPGADVYLQVQGGQILGLAATDDNATYSFSNLTPGNYSIIVQIEGYMWSSNPNVTAGNDNVSDIVIPDYVHYPIVTPWPIPKNETQAPPDGKNASLATTVTPIPPGKNTAATANATLNSTNGTGAISKAQNGTSDGTSSRNVSTAVNNSTSITGGGGGIGDIINGIINFIKSIFGM